MWSGSSSTDRSTQTVVIKVLQECQLHVPKTRHCMPLPEKSLTTQMDKYKKVFHGKKSSLSSGFCSKCIEHRELKRNSREPNCMCGKQVILSKKNIYKHANTTIDEWCHYHSTQNDKSIHSRGRPIFSPTAVQPEQIKRDYFQDECDPHETSYWKRCGETVSHEEFLKGKEKRSTYPPHVGITRCGCTETQRHPTANCSDTMPFHCVLHVIHNDI